ncbi:NICOTIANAMINE SYNTHASE [Salix purpurea]|uniref:Nicotianamine synthase n=1 Tax=Salix purpurea TaxID=77065 RepID=A0A9Q0WEH8_SALPP|nr:NICOTIANAMINE SYNTHASE [Salix purpurea]
MLLFLFLYILSFSSSSLSLNQEGLYLQQTKLSLSDPDLTLSGTERPVWNVGYGTERLINLCGHAEGLFPYYGNYVKLASIEYRILNESGVSQPRKVAFVGSGPLPLTSFIMATHHMKLTHFDNFDIDEAANDVARQIVASDHELEKRMKFETGDITEVQEKLSEYDCIFLAALVGMSKVDKVKILGHIRKYMKEGGVLLVRSAKGARAFLYPVVEEQDVLGFELLSIYHPTNDVINSVVLLRKPAF